MGKIVEKKRKKKKGRPSLLDIQKRNLRQQQQQNQTTQKPNPNPNATATPNRRFTRRNPDPDGIPPDDDDNDNYTNRRQKKLNHLNSPYLDLGLYGSDSYEEDEEPEPEPEEETPLKKRKINASSPPAPARSTATAAKKGEKQNLVKATERQQQQQNIDRPGETGPTTPLPDKKLLVFILDRLQKKDTYGVYAEPVDPDELLDYHEIVSNPMDFGTVRKKLEEGAYANLEQFESDVFLITSNAMQYNAPDTIYFRQARTIQELARKDFENLRQDSDNEQRPKIVRRGRPPTKHLKNQLGKTSSEREGLDDTLIKGGDNTAWSNGYNLRKGHLADKCLSGDSARRPYGSRNSEGYSCLSENKFDKNEEFSGSSAKGFPMKYGKKQIAFDESRRNTYSNSNLPDIGSESSVLNTFNGEIKQLLPVGLHTEHGYARSLARFAANLGPLAWKVASKKIERALPPGMKFGPGWVGEDEAPPAQTSSLATSSQCLLPEQHPFSSPQVSSSSAMPLIVESNQAILSRQEDTNNSSIEGYPISTIPSITTSSYSASIPLEPNAASVEAASRLNDGGFGLISNSGVGVRPPFQIHQNTFVNTAMNGFSGGFGSSLSTQMGKLGRPAGSLTSDGSVHSRIFDMASKSNFFNSMPANHSELYNSKPSSSSTINSGNFALNPISGIVPNSIHEAQTFTSIGFDSQPCLNGLLLQQNPGSIPPDLNVRFQSPGSPSSSIWIDSQPDLALQL